MWRRPRIPQVVVANLHHADQQPGKILSSQAFDPNADYRWPGNAGQSQQRVEVSIQCDNHHTFLASDVENFRISCCR
jgi:hypothetical protein